MNATIITIGDEILIGQILDTNAAWLGRELTLLGINVNEVRSIPDQHDHIVKTLDEVFDASDLIFLTGGLGPTKDDVTKKALAQYFESNLVFDQALFDKITGYFKKIGLTTTDAHREQCFMPDNIKTLANNMGTAPGMLFSKNNTHVLSMPGVPYEMKWIFEHSFKPFLNETLNKDLFIYHKTVRTVGIGETRIAEMIEDISDTLPDHISLSFLPSLGEVKLRLTAKAPFDPKEEVDKFANAIAERMAHRVYGYDRIKLEEALLRDFTLKNKTLSTAESCTGGYLAHKITSVPGSSDFYQGSYIVYQNALKSSLLDVKEETLSDFGAVSEEVVLQMLEGVLDRTQTDLGVAISGIAGPGGGSKEKPVGTIWLAYGTKEDKRTKKLQLGKDRLKNIEYTAVAAMNSLRLFLTEL